MNVDFLSASLALHLPADVRCGALGERYVGVRSSTLPNPLGVVMNLLTGNDL